MADMLDIIKKGIRRTHDKLDDDLQGDIDACIADLHACGVVYASTEDPLIINAVKLYCRAMNTDDPARGAAYMQRYDALKSCLMMAEGYGREVAADA